LGQLKGSQIEAAIGRGVTTGGVSSSSGSTTCAQGKWMAVIMVHQLGMKSPISTKEKSLEEIFQCELVNPQTNGWMLHPS
jgi:hypothetical protein